MTRRRREDRAHPARSTPFTAVPPLFLSGLPCAGGYMAATSYIYVCALSILQYLLRMCILQTMNFRS